jgi:hypothetical protein
METTPITATVSTGSHSLYSCPHAQGPKLLCTCIAVATKTLYCMTVLNNLISHPLVSTADQPTYHGVVIVVHNERYLKDPGN